MKPQNNTMVMVPNMLVNNPMNMALNMVGNQMMMNSNMMGNNPMNMATNMMGNNQMGMGNPMGQQQNMGMIINQSQNNTNKNKKHIGCKILRSNMNTQFSNSINNTGMGIQADPMPNNYY